MAIPWIELIKHAPTILTLSREVLQRSRKPADAPMAGTEGVETLAADLQRQAEVLHALAGQIDRLTAALASVRRAILLAVGLGITALIVAMAALVMALLC